MNPFLEHQAFLTRCQRNAASSVMILLLAFSAPWSAGAQADGSAKAPTLESRVVADGKEASADEAKTPGVDLALSAASGKFAVEWYRAADGTAQPGGVIAGGKPQTLRSPWRGQDCVVRLRREYGG